MTTTKTGVSQQEMEKFLKSLQSLATVLPSFSSPGNFIFGLFVFFFRPYYEFGSTEKCYAKSPTALTSLFNQRQQN